MKIKIFKKLIDFDDYYKIKIRFYYSKQNFLILKIIIIDKNYEMIFYSAS